MAKMMKFSDYADVVLPMNLDAWRRRAPVAGLDPKGIADSLQKDAAEELGGIVRAFSKIKAEVMADPDLTASGRRNKLRLIADQHLGKVAAFETSKADKIKTRAEGIASSALRAATITPPADPGERIGFELRLAEIRAALRAMPADARCLAYQKGDRLVQAAVESAPPMFEASSDPSVFPGLQPLVAAETVTGVQQARVRAERPEDAALFDGLNDLAREYRTMSAAARSEMLEDRGAPERITTDDEGRKRFNAGGGEAA